MGNRSSAEILMKGQSNSRKVLDGTNESKSND
jgi:hypothetical protein